MGELAKCDKRPHDDWQLVKPEFQLLITQHSIGCRFDVNLFTDGVPGQPCNSQCVIFHSVHDDAFDYPWVCASSYGNPVYSLELITKVLRKAISDYNESPTNTSFMIILPD